MAAKTKIITGEKGNETTVIPKMLAAKGKATFHLPMENLKKLMMKPKDSPTGDCDCYHRFTEFCVEGCDECEIQYGDKDDEQLSGDTEIHEI